MRVERLKVEAAPGLPEGLPELELDPGLTIIMGPNASGKSTLARALRALLWPEKASSDLRVRAMWSTDQGPTRAELFAGAVHWQPALSVPPPPGAAKLARFGIRSLLAANDEHDQKLGKQVALELAGGLDLAAATQRFGQAPRLSSAKTAAKQRTQARARLQQVKGRAHELAGLEALRGELALRVEQAEQAHPQLAAAERLRELVQAQEALAVMQSLPHSAGLDRLIGDEAQRVQQLTATRAKHAAARGERDRELGRLAERVAANSFPDATPTVRDLEAWTTRLERLAGLETQAAETRARVLGAEQEQLEARREVLGDPTRSELSAADLDQLAEGIGALRDARAELTSQRTTSAAWAAGARDDGVDPGPLREVAMHLRAWLRTPDPDQHAGQPAEPRAAPRPAGLAWILITAGLLCAALALALSTPWLASGLFLTGLGVARLVGAGAAPGRPPEGDPEPAARDASRRAVERAQEAPQAWEPVQVERHLLAIDARLGALEQAGRALEKLAESRRLEQAAEARVGQQAAQLADLARGLGVAPEFVELGALLQARALHRWLDVRDAHAHAARELAQLAQEVSAGLAACADWFSSVGCDAPLDVVAARAEVRDLGHRRGELARALSETAAAEQVRADHEREHAAVEQTLAEVWERSAVEPGDLAGLDRRLEAHGEWTRHQQQLRDARGRLADCRERYARAAPLTQLGTTAPELAGLADVEAWIADLTEQTQQQTELSREAGMIATKLAAAAEGHDLQDSLADRLEAEQRIAAEREQAVVDALARDLLDQARASHESAHTPATLRRAQAQFSRFTHGGWRLEVAPNGELRAVDLTLDQAHTLEQLSDATRTQLLLAVRLAALEQLESPGQLLPICLDEALSTTDPARFSVIAEALLELADDGRQVLYFTADPGEAAQWRQVCELLQRPAPRVLDLGVLRGAPADWGGSLPAIPPRAEPLPDRSRLTHAEYARALGVARPDGFLAESSWHLYFITHDELETLEACLLRHISSVGHWCEARRRGNTPVQIQPEVALRLDAHAELASALLELWRIGRGQPVTWDVVKDSKAIKKNTYEDRVRVLLAEHARDPRRFVEEVGGLKNFKGAMLAKLTSHLEQAGCLPAEEPLPLAALTRQCLQAAPAATERLGPERAAAYVGWLAEALS